MTDAAAADTTHIDEIRAGYAFEGGAIKLGAAVVDGEAHADAPVQIPLRQSVFCVHVCPAGQRGQVEVPPQSTPLSRPFLV